MFTSFQKHYARLLLTFTILLVAVGPTFTAVVDANPGCGTAIPGC